MGLTLDAGIFLVCMVLILIFAVVSNFIVIFIVIRNKKMRSVTNVFIGNLAFSDIFLGAVVLPMRLHDLSHAENFHEGIAFLIDVFMHWHIFSRSTAKFNPNFLVNCVSTINFIFFWNFSNAHIGHINTFSKANIFYVMFNG